MARKVTISRDMILEAALKILIRDGYAAVNIKTIASEIGCSTQPVVWHLPFGHGGCQKRGGLTGWRLTG